MRRPARSPCWRQHLLILLQCRVSSVLLRTWTSQIPWPHLQLPSIPQVSLPSRVGPLEHLQVSSLPFQTLSSCTIPPVLSCCYAIRHLLGSPPGLVCPFLQDSPPSLPPTVVTLPTISAAENQVSSKVTGCQSNILSQGWENTSYQSLPLTSVLGHKPWDWSFPKKSVTYAHLEQNVASAQLWAK